MSTEIIGLSHLEREIIANVVRYNIRDFDYDKVQLETQVHQEEDIGCLLYTSPFIHPRIPGKERLHASKGPCPEDGCRRGNRYGGG